MKFLNEFIFDKEADAKKFIKDMSDLYYHKGYLSYGDVCKAYYSDDVDYNSYDIYNSHGWICFYAFVVEPYTIIESTVTTNKFIVRFPKIEKLKQILNKGE